MEMLYGLRFLRILFFIAFCFSYFLWQEGTDIRVTLYNA
jgi:hypothetical protein